jgi:hypothetical protein
MIICQNYVELEIIKPTFSEKEKKNDLRSKSNQIKPLNHDEEHAYHDKKQFLSKVDT